MTMRYILAAAILINVSLASAQTALPADSKIVAPMLPLLQALAAARLSGSIELSSQCGGEPFPSLRPSSGGGSVLQLVRRMFADYAKMQVKQDADGMIRMVEIGADTDLLNVKISYIGFESKGIPLQYAAFNPDAALRQILQSPEIVAFAKNHDIDFAIRGAGSLFNQPVPDALPHVESMIDVTLAQALDSVLKKFPGVWLYKLCPESDRRRQSVFIMFLNLQNPGLVELQEQTH